MGARASGRPGASVTLFQNNFMGEALFLCSYKGIGRGEAKKVVFLSQPCMKLPIKLFYQTVFFKTQLHREAAREVVFKKELY
jgi:hypothetical protein